MSTLRKKAKSLPKGYTILEICLVLFIGALITAASLPVISSILEEQKFQTAVSRLENLAMQARHQAIILHQPQSIILREKSFSLAMIESEFSQDPKEINSNFNHLSKGMTLLVKQWQETDWHKPEEINWVFQPNGITEPMQIKLVKDSAWVEISFDPLTANIQTEHSFIP